MTIATDSYRTGRLKELPHWFFTTRGQIHLLYYVTNAHS